MAYFVGIFFDACESGDIDSIEKEIMNGVPGWYFNAGLRSVCRDGYINIAKLLIEHGADDWNGGLRKACEGGHLDIIKLMVEHGGNEFNKALYDACKHDNVDIIDFLVIKGANSFNGGLEIACRYGNANTVLLLIKYGANNFDMAMINAQSGNHIHIIKILFDHGADPNTYCYTYPRDKRHIFDMLDIGIPIHKIDRIHGIKKFINQVKKKKELMKDVLSDHLIGDIVKMIDAYVAY